MYKITLLTRSMVAFLVLSLFSACSATANKRSFGEVVDDAVITNKLKTKYMKDKVVKAFKVDIDTWKGVVQLKGTVTDQQQIDRAVEIAEQLPGVKEVKSYLVLNGEQEWKPKKSSGSSKQQQVEEVDLTAKSKPSAKAEAVESQNDTQEEAGFVDEETQAPSKVVE